MVSNLKFKTPKDLKKAVDSYFESTEKITMGGLASHLKISRKNLLAYSDRPDFVDILNEARAKIEAKYEEILIYGGKGNVAGVVFALKNLGKGKNPNFEQWTDKTQLEADNRIEYLVTFKEPHELNGERKEISN